MILSFINHLFLLELTYISIDDEDMLSHLSEIKFTTQEKDDDLSD